MKTHRAWAPMRIPTNSAVSGRKAGSLLLGDDLVLDAVIGLLRDDILLHQFVLALVGPALDDRRRIGFADARESVELVGAGGIDVEQIGPGSGRHLGIGFWRRCHL